MARCQNCGEDPDLNREIRSSVRALLGGLPAFIGLLERDLDPGRPADRQLAALAAEGREGSRLLAELLDQADSPGR